jgi:hypothetical protein
VSRGFNYLVPDQETLCPRHGYPGPCPGALDMSRGFNYLVPDQETLCPRHGYPGPCPGALDISRGFYLLGPRPSTPGLHCGPYISSRVLAILPEKWLSQLFINLTISLSYDHVNIHQNCHGAWHEVMNQNG